MIIRIEETKKVLSKLGGLALVKKVIDTGQLSASLENLLPTKNFSGRTSPAQKFIGLVYGFACDADCLDDLEALAEDPGFESSAGKLISSNRYSEFLSNFTSVQLRKMQDVLIEMSLSLRQKTTSSDEFTLVLDSTKHQQFGLRQEGVNWSYPEYKCLDSLHAYDELGFCYWNAVRPGETHTASGSEEVISTVLRKLPSTYKKKYVLADSGFYDKDFFNTCAINNARFIVAMRSNVYSPLLQKLLTWKRPPQKMKFFDGRDFEFAETIYHPSDCQRTLRIVLVRSLKQDHAQGLFRGEDYNYAAFATDIGMHEMNAIDVLKKYRKRSNAENFIREMKNGINTRRFQCRRLVSNGALALAASFAHNILRFIAHLHRTGNDKIHFAKKLRNKLLNIPCQVVKHGREVIFRMVENFSREVKRILNKITSFNAVFINGEKDHHCSFTIK